MRRLALLLIIAPLVRAQIQDLAVTDDGGQLYFSTPYRFPGSGQANYAKIFRFAERGFELFRQIEVQSIPATTDTNFYLANRPMVSGDGTIVGYTAARNCFGGSHCIGYVLYSGCLASANGTDRCSLGLMTLSPDGVYALSFEQISNLPFGGTTGSVWTELATGATTALRDANPIGDGKQALANGGAALLADATGPFLWNRGQIMRLPIAAVGARLSPNGQVIVYASASAELHSYRIASGQDVLLAKQKGSAIWHPWITNDGSKVIFVLNGDLYVENTDGTGMRELASPPEGIADSIISGFGNTVYVATSTSRLLRINLPTGSITEMCPDVPVATLVSGVGAIGALMDFEISGALARDARPELIGGDPAQEPPIVAASKSRITIQVPWEAPTGARLRITFPPNPGPFEWAPVAYGIALVSPSFYTVPGSSRYSPLAAHQDFSALVTEDKPAHAGEIVHLYATGLGPLTPSLATGIPAPIGTLFRTQFELSCESAYDVYPLRPLTVLFTGLAPTMIGVEQVDVLIPTDIPNPVPQAGVPLLYVYCRLQSPGFASTLSTVGVPLLP